MLERTEKLELHTDGIKVVHTQLRLKRVVQISQLILYLDFGFNFQLFCTCNGE